MLVGKAEKKYHVLNEYRNIVINGSREQAQEYYRRNISPFQYRENKGDY